MKSPKIKLEAMSIIKAPYFFQLIGEGKKKGSKLEMSNCWRIILLSKVNSLLYKAKAWHFNLSPVKDPEKTVQ